VYLFPAIDLINGQVVRLLQGDYGKQTTYEADALECAQAYEAAGCSWLHVVDLDGAKTGMPMNLDVSSSICEGTNLQVEVGGGIRDEVTIDRLLDVGVKRVILGTAALRNWHWFEPVVQEMRFERRIVLGLDARKGKVAVAGWEEELELTALEIAERVNGWPLAAIVFTDIATDGTLEGPNIESTTEIADATDVPIVSSGGVGTLDHLRALRDCSYQGAIVGRALYDGAFTIDEAMDVLERGK
jgi:phosphoribosylformimino-5-aminoimidazole carboxamide ribotide isomerase